MDLKKLRRNFVWAMNHAVRMEGWPEFNNKISSCKESLADINEAIESEKIKQYHSEHPPLESLD